MDNRYVDKYTVHPCACAFGIVMALLYGVKLELTKPYEVFCNRRHISVHVPATFSTVFELPAGTFCSTRKMWSAGLFIRWCTTAVAKWSVQSWRYQELVPEHTQIALETLANLRKKASYCRASPSTTQASISSRLFLDSLTVPPTGQLNRALHFWQFHEKTQRREGLVHTTKRCKNKRMGLFVRCFAQLLQQKLHGLERIRMKLLSKMTVGNFTCSFSNFDFLLATFMWPWYRNLG